ncbi:MAG: glycerophosphoryl diester phosphodiesterase [Solirubrobacteraceae bacterium]|jgi:glycerophosphoryl diester phosphodiesterase|nr:glycerophosphoryl diester phosphodiesterase [Solirubrobacteraceae bacterium]
MSALKRVGHKGADLIAPGNTVASFDAALEVGVDMIEFDVLPARHDDRLVLAHDYEDAETRPELTLEEGLEHLGSSPFAGVELDVDLKLPGYEQDVLDALRARGLLDRALISSQYRESLAVLRAAEPDVRLGWSVPKLQQDPFRHRLMWIPATAVVLAWRELLPFWAATAIRRGECDALMAHWRLVTPRLARSIARAGGELYVWTVDEPSRIRSLERLGATGVITNDPRLFTQAAS